MVAEMTHSENALHDIVDNKVIDSSYRAFSWLNPIGDLNKSVIHTKCYPHKDQHKYRHKSMRAPFASTSATSLKPPL